MKTDQRGQILISLIIVAPALMLIVSSYLALSVNSLRLAIQDQMHTQAQIAADAGADYSIEQLNQDSSWTGVSETPLHTGDSYVKTTFASSLTVNSASSDTITVIGRAYNPSTASTPTASVTIKVDLLKVSSGSYSVASGEGGLIMSNSSKITGGAVLINGTVSLSNTAQIGLSTNPVTVQVADAVCPNPADSTYPRICTTGDNQPQPISINNSARIYGSVSANNQTSGAGMSSPGLVASSGVSTQALPTYDRAAQEAAVTTTLPSGFSCNNGSQTWAANTKIVGNASISNSCKVTVLGNVWITGTLSVSNSAQLIVDNSLGSTRPVIMVDGSGGASFSNGATLVPNTSNTGFEVITFYADASCSPECTSLTGADLYNSQGITTISLNNSASAANTVFYSYWTKVVVSNIGQIGALIGQTIKLDNNGTITFTTSTGTGTSSWVIDGYRRSY